MRLTVSDALIPLCLKATKANQPFVTADGARRRVRERFGRPVPFGPPRRLEGVEVRRRLPDPLGWPVYDVVPASAGGRPSASDGVVVYLHGGGRVHEIAPQHWRLIARIARETGAGRTLSRTRRSARCSGTWRGWARSRSTPAPTTC